ncbi:MAG: hypothetical protein HZC44_08295 [Geobacter sp.]|nr:hypothetical protein [Geobacter sp.]
MRSYGKRALLAGLMLMLGASLSLAANVNVNVQGGLPIPPPPPGLPLPAPGMVVGGNVHVDNGKHAGKYKKKKTYLKRHKKQGRSKRGK